MPHEALDLTRRLASRAVALEYTDLSGAARMVAKHCILDWFGVALAATSEPLVAILARWAAEEGGTPRATVVGSGERVSLAQAALINGAMSHALDFDDVNLTIPGHATVAVLPAILALVENRRASGRHLVAALVAGVETACRVGQLVSPEHYLGGWHATATVGVFGAAAAASRLIGLDPETAAHAFGIAGTQAAGLKCVFGTMCKPLHAGRAAAVGLEAARLAERGYTGNPAFLECRQGFIDIHTTSAGAGTAVAHPSEFLICRTLFKYHAACYLTHSTIEAVRRLRVRFDPSSAEVERIIVRVDPGHIGTCSIEAPRTGLETKFSLRAVAALALVGEDTSREQLFRDATALRADVAALRERVTVETRVGSSQTEAEVELHLSGGRMLKEACDTGVPEKDLRRQELALRRKFMTLTQPVLGEAAQSLADLCLALDDVDDASALLAASLVRRRGA